jgi:LAO/AO transport system kinase
MLVAAPVVASGSGAADPVADPVAPPVAGGGGGGAGVASHRPRPKRPEVLVTTASTGDGVPELLEALDRHRALGRSAAGDAARLARADRQVWAIVGERLRSRLDPGGPHGSATDATLRAVAAHQLDPYAAADRLLASLDGAPRRPAGD